MQNPNTVKLFVDGATISPISRSILLIYFRPNKKRRMKMKLKIFAVLVFFLVCAVSIFAEEGTASSDNGANIESTQQKVELSENFVIKFGLAGEYVFMSSLNSMLDTLNQNPTITDNGYTKTNTGILGTFEIDYKSNSLYVGPEFGYLYCMPASRHYSPTANPTATYKYTYNTSLIPLEIGVGYDLPLKKIMQNLDFPIAFNFSVYSGYSWASMTTKWDVTNDPVNGSYNATVNYYGGGIASDLNLGLKYINTTGSGITAGINLGYKYDVIPYVQTDKQYSLTTSNGRTITTPKDSVLKFGNDNNMQELDFRGIVLSVYAGYAF